MNVSIDGSQCMIETLSDTEIVCLTGEHRQSVETHVTVNIIDDGDAVKVGIVAESVPSNVSRPGC